MTQLEVPYAEVHPHLHQGTRLIMMPRGADVITNVHLNQLYALTPAMVCRFTWLDLCNNI